MRKVVLSVVAVLVAVAFSGCGQKLSCEASKPTPKPVVVQPAPAPVVVDAKEASVN